VTTLAPERPSVQRAGTAPLLQVADLRVSFAQGERVIRAVDGFSCTLRAGQTIAVVGESGSGKTVSSRAITGLLPSAARISGSVRFEGVELLGKSPQALRRHRGTDFAMVFQDPARSLNPTMRVGAQIAEAVRVHEPLSRAQAEERAVELLQMVRIPSAGQRARDYPHQLSGGMRQRVMIAIAIASRPKLLIADEATTALDVTTQAQIMDLLSSLQRQFNMAVIMITHDLGLAATYTDEVIVMYAGRVVEQAPTRTLFSNLRMPYTRALLDAMPHLDRAPHELLAIVAGRPPNLGDLPPGCPFNPRCPRVSEICRERRPALAEQEPGHSWACHHPIGLEGIAR
jgi:oligopeptide/dipeptide ABC transporter ATP-binding protein